VRSGSSQIADLSNETLDVVAEPSPGVSGCRRTNADQVEPAGQVGETEGFPEATTDPVAHDGRAHCARDRECHPRWVQVVGPDSENPVGAGSDANAVTP